MHRGDDPHNTLDIYSTCRGQNPLRHGMCVAENAAMRRASRTLLLFVEIFPHGGRYIASNAMFYT